MKNINDTLSESVDRFGPKYSCYPDEINMFLTGSLDFLERQKTAERIIEGILREHGKEELIGGLAELGRVESGIRALAPHARDHVVHALLTFILGIFINEAYFEANGVRPVSPFQWKLACLLHDVGYPIEMSINLIEPFEDTTNRLRRKFGAIRPVHFHIKPTNLRRLAGDKDALGLVQDQLSRWELEIDARKEYSSMVRTGRICHGIISALSVLSIIDAMYQANNPKRVKRRINSPNSNLDWNETFFVDDIVAACAAIFIHNLQPRCFRKAKINPRTATLPFLLVLCDSLQEWERPSFVNPTGSSANLFDIEVSDCTLYFYADLPNEIKHRISESLDTLLDVDNVVIKQLGDRKANSSL